MGLGKMMKRLFRGEKFWKKNSQPSDVLLSVLSINQDEFCYRRLENSVQPLPVPAQKVSDYEAIDIASELNSDDPTREDIPPLSTEIIAATVENTPVVGFSAILVDGDTNDKISTERDELIKERDELKSKLIQLQENLRRSEEEKEELCIRLRDCVEIYGKQILELQLELKAQSSPSIITTNAETQTTFSEETAANSVIKEPPRQEAVSQASEDLHSSTPSMTAALLECEPLGSEPLVLAEPCVDLSSTKTEIVTRANICETSADKKEDVEILEPTAVFPVFHCTDVRYKGLNKIPGYTVIPKQMPDKSETANLSNLVLDSDPASEKPKPLANFNIRDQVVKTEFRGTHVILTNISAVHFGRILGKRGGNVMALKDKFGVRILVSSPKGPDDRIRVTITSGSAADRHAAAEHIMEELPAQVEVFFGVGFLSYGKIQVLRKSHPFVTLQDNGQGQYVMSGKLRECRQAFEQLKSGLF